MLMESYDQMVEHVFGSKVLDDGSWQQVLKLHKILLQTNEEIWDHEDQIRDCERKEDFGETFVETARAIYRTNDYRCQLKREINELFSSVIIEEKSYKPY